MKYQTPLLTLLMLGLAGMFLVNRYALAKPSAADGTKQKWEYCRLAGGSYHEDNRYTQILVSATTPEGKPIDSDYYAVTGLDKLGAEGWELVAVMPGNNGIPEYILKRPKP